MISYEKITKDNIEGWNNELKKTDASYFQYPYYCAGYDYMPNSSCTFYTINENATPIAFLSIVNIKVGFLKIGLIIRGPVMLKTGSEEDIIKGLMLIQKKESYFFLRINPNYLDTKLEECLISNKAVIPKDPFPIYKGAQDRDFVVNLENDEKTILYSFKSSARQKINYAREDEFTYSKLKSIEEFEEVYSLLKSVSDTKGFAYRPKKSYEAIFKQGLPYNLCEVYRAYYQGRLVNAIIVMKDKNITTNHSGGLIHDTYNKRNAPSAYLHHQIILDAKAENKKYYNFSYSNKNSPVYIFKSLFNPQEIFYPKYYTITSSVTLLKLFVFLTSRLTTSLKKLIRRKHGNK